MGRNPRLFRFVPFTMNKERLIRLRKITTNHEIIDLISKYKFSDDEFDALLLVFRAMDNDKRKKHFLDAVVKNQPLLPVH